MRQFLFWVVFNVPLGKLAPYILGLAFGRIPHKLEDKNNIVTKEKNL